MAELEAEIEKSNITPPTTAAPPQPVEYVNNSKGFSSGKVLPAGATPGHGGALNAHAAEFWFPECRNCACCHGFKHGCSCCKGGGVDTCQDPNCINQEFSSQVASTLASRTPTSSTPITESSRPAHSPSPSSYSNHSSYGGSQGPGGNGGGAGGGAGVCRFFLQGSCRFGPSCRFLHTSSSTSSSSGTPTSGMTMNSGSGFSSGGKVLPVGATPGHGGALNAHAAEFWFPECRNCACCNGFKHGCSCCKGGGVDTCQDPNCSVSSGGPGGSGSSGFSSGGGGGGGGGAPSPVRYLPPAMSIYEAPGGSGMCR
jgi:hypothetical protein